MIFENDLRLSKNEIDHIIPINIVFIQMFCHFIFFVKNTFTLIKSKVKKNGNIQIKSRQINNKQTIKSRKLLSYISLNLRMAIINVRLLFFIFVQS